MAQRTTLTERQVNVLRWIAEGCPDGVMADEHHRISAAALRRRGLVRVSGRGATWRATVTSAGREYLERVDSDDPPIPRQANVSLTEQLVQDVIDAGGTLRLPRPRWPEPGVDYTHRARLAERLGKVPPRKQLLVTSDRDEIELKLIDTTTEFAVPERIAIDVPAKIGRYHPVARAFRDNTDRHEVSREQLPRATRIVHAIATEADRRGWKPQAPTVTPNRYGRAAWSGGKDGHIHLDVAGRSFHLRMFEQGVHQRGPWIADVHRFRNINPEWPLYRDREVPTGAYDKDATGTLRLELHDERAWVHSGRQSNWSDRQSWTLEERLPHLFQEIEARIIEAARADERARILAAEAAETERRAAEEREREWAAHMATARERFMEAPRASQLRRQVDDWHLAERIRRYCAAASDAHGDAPATRQWLDWALAHADQLDPLARAPAMPATPEPTPEDLKPYLPKSS